MDNRKHYYILDDSGQVVCEMSTKAEVSDERPMIITYEKLPGVKKFYNPQTKQIECYDYVIENYQYVIDKKNYRPDMVKGLDVIVRPDNFSILTFLPEIIKPTPKPTLAPKVIEKIVEVEVEKEVPVEIIREVPQKGIIRKTIDFILGK